MYGRPWHIMLKKETYYTIFLYSKNHLLCPSVVIIMLSKITIMLQWNVIKFNKINPFDPEFFCFFFNISHTLSQCFPHDKY